MKRGGTYGALERTSVEDIAVKIKDGRCGLVVRTILDKGVATILLVANLDNVAKVGEERVQVLVCGEGGQVSHIDGHDIHRRPVVDGRVVGLLLGRIDHCLAVGRHAGRHHSSVHHRLGLGHGRLAFLVCPVDANLAGAEPLAIHFGDCANGTFLAAVGDETVSASAARLHVPHDARLGDIAESLECLQQGLVGDLVGQVADKDVEVARGVFLVGGVGLIGPVDADLAIIDFATVHDQHGVFGGGGIVELDEAVVEALGVNVLVRDELDARDGALVEGAEDLGELVFGAIAGQAADVKRAIAALDLRTAANAGRTSGGCQDVAAVGGGRHGLWRSDGGGDGIRVRRNSEGGRSGW